MRYSLLTGILWLPAWHVLSAILGALIPLPPFSFRMGLRRTLLPRVGGWGYQRKPGVTGRVPTVAGLA